MLIFVIREYEIFRTVILYFFRSRTVPDLARSVRPSYVPSLMEDENKVASERELSLAPGTIELGHTNETRTNKALMSILHNKDQCLGRGRE